LTECLQPAPTAVTSAGAALGPAALPIATGDAEQGPLSVSQEQVWFMMQARPDDTAYNVSCRLRLGGPVNPVALRDSLAEVFQRHPLLHCVLVRDAGRDMPRWQRRPDLPLPLTRIDLTSLPI